MKKTVFTLAVLLMALGNVGFAQHKADLESEITANVLKHYGVRDVITVVPQSCLVKASDGTMARSTYLYDEDEYYLNEEVFSMEMNGQWWDFIKISYQYDFSGNVLEKLTQMDVSGTGNWIDAEFVSYTYEAGELSEVIVQSTDDGNEWVNKSKEVYTYSGNVTTVLYCDWSGTTWSSDELYTYTYNDTRIDLLIQYMQGGAWQNDEKDTYALDSNGNVKEILVEDWENSSWVNDKRTTYNFEGDVFTSRLFETWDGTAWESSYRSNYEYESGNATLGKCEKFEAGQWSPADGTIEMTYGYNAKTIKFNSCCQVEATYVDLTGIEEDSQAVGFKVYPVPAEDEIAIEAESFQKAEVYSLTGQMLMESTMNKLSVSTLSQGVYVLKVYDQTGRSESQRIVVK